MHIAKARLIAFFLCVFAATLRAEEPGAPPTKSKIPADESPKDALLRGSRVIEQGDLDAVVALYEVSDPLEREMLTSCCKYYIALTRIELAVRHQFGRRDADELVRALGESTDDDVRKAEVKIAGDKATVSIPGNSTLIMVRVQGVWKIALHEVRTGMSDEEVKSQTKTNDAMARVLAGLPEKVRRGDFSKAADLIDEAKRLLDSVQPPMAEKEK